MIKLGKTTRNWLIWKQDMIGTNHFQFCFRSPTVPNGQPVEQMEALEPPGTQSAIKAQDPDA
jgi:hypothetical protein